VDVHSDHLLRELAAQRQGELISAARQHELARAASAGRPGVVERLRQLRLTLAQWREPTPADRPYVRTWVLARSTGGG
jgi:hypothetical protein